MLQREVLIRELLAVNALASCAVVTGEVAALQHELFNYTVEARLPVSKALLMGAQSTEVLCGLRYLLVVQL